MYVNKMSTSVSLRQDLSPFTTYHVNVSAIPKDRSYRPPAKITVTTQMAAPQPMVKPDFYGVHKVSSLWISASEETLPAKY
jgi:netrin-G3 ligand